MNTASDYEETARCAELLLIIELNYFHERSCSNDSVHASLTARLSVA